MENKDRSALRNRLYGLLLISVVVVAFWFWPPTQSSHNQRGAIDLLKDFGMGDIAFKLRLALHWGVGIAAVLLGGYQVVTGEKIKKSEW